MAILRSRGVAADPVAIANPAVDQAMRLWQERVEQAREEGRQAGLVEAAATLNEAKKTKADAAGGIAAAKQAADQQVAAERARMVDEMGRALVALHEVVEGHESLRGDVLRAAEREVVDMACALAARILRHAVHHDQAWMDDLLRQALALAPDKRRVLLRMHPTDAGHVAELLPGIEQRLGMQGAVDLIADEHLSRGSCLLESGGTSIDAGVAGSWSRLREQLLLAAPSDHWEHLAVVGEAEAAKRVGAVLDSPAPVDEAPPDESDDLPVDDEPSAADDDQPGDEDAQP